MRVSKLRPAFAAPRARADDRVAAVVIAVLLVWFVVRRMIPAFVEGSGIGAVVAVGAFLAVALGIALQPAGRRRRARRKLGCL